MSKVDAADYFYLDYEPCDNCVNMASRSCQFTRAHFTDMLEVIVDIKTDGGDMLEHIADGLVDIVGCSKSYEQIYGELGQIVSKTMELRG